MQPVWREDRHDLTQPVAVRFVAGRRSVLPSRYARWGKGCAEGLAVCACCNDGGPYLSAAAAELESPCSSFRRG